MTIAPTHIYITGTKPSPYTLHGKANKDYIYVIFVCFIYGDVYTKGLNYKAFHLEMYLNNSPNNRKSEMSFVV